MTDGDKDYRYTIRVYLLRQDRPRYFDFKCNYCGTKVCELNGVIVYLSDITHDNNSLIQPTNRFRCSGRECRTWYEFVLN